MHSEEKIIHNMLRGIIKIASKYHTLLHRSMLLSIIKLMIEIVMENKSEDLDRRKYKIIQLVRHLQVNNQEILNIAESSTKKHLLKEKRNLSIIIV